METGHKVQNGGVSSFHERFYTTTFFWRQVSNVNQHVTMYQCCGQLEKSWKWNFWKNSENFTLKKNFENFWAKNLVQKWFEWWKISINIHNWVLRALETFIGYYQSSPFIRFNFKEIQTWSNSCCSTTWFCWATFALFDEHSLSRSVYPSKCQLLVMFRCTKKTEKASFLHSNDSGSGWFTGENNL